MLNLHLKNMNQSPIFPRSRLLNLSTLFASTLGISILKSLLVKALCLRTLVFHSSVDVFRHHDILCLLQVPSLHSTFSLCFWFLGGIRCISRQVPPLPRRHRPEHLMFLCYAFFVGIEILSLLIQ